jgi:hypothetical protein
MPVDPSEPVVTTLVCLNLPFAREAVGAAGTRHSLRPLFTEGHCLAKLGPIAPRDRGVVFGFAVIAKSQRVPPWAGPMINSATKQAILSLRGAMDCFAEPVIGLAKGETRRRGMTARFLLRQVAMASVPLRSCRSFGVARHPKPKASGGGEGRTRTFEAMRRLIYSQLPLPLGTLPRSTASQPNRRDGRDEGDR